MSQYNDFGGASNPYYSNGASGGGYMPTGSPFSASGSPGGLKRSEASHSLRPLTAAQIIKATQAHTDADWMIDDMEVGQVTIVGQVCSVQAQATNCVYWIDDGTGRVEARHWVDSSNEEDAEKWSGIEDGVYIRVTGGLKTFGNKRYINATHMRPVKDAHEIYFHTLEAIHVTLILERGPPLGIGQAAQPRAPANATAITGGTNAYANQSSSVANFDEYSHLPALQRSIIRFILEQPHNDEGIHVAAIARAIGTDGDALKISQALDQLMDEGHVFSTIDDSHFNVSR
ncbi:hypothetical protein BDQ12DRAFT_278987 [Crucibulum laeve]|uniref:Replication protein A C-terminal domain-containing protein n=1 Tax=Crucibulum laeve TaxID=68775 RepID=A0A5C3MC83_9AGAR|nr:hypothetical protein BDQ12DRAFT_278987 [Crucibulum laeve]